LAGNATRKILKQNSKQKKNWINSGNRNLISEEFSVKGSNGKLVKMTGEWDRNLKKRLSNS